MKPILTIDRLKAEALKFATSENNHDEPSLYGVTDGKAVGTYLEHKFTSLLSKIYEYERGNTASGIDIPNLEIDYKKLQASNNHNLLAHLNRLLKKFLD